MEVRVRGKTVKKKIKGQQPKKVECGTMLVNAGSGVGWKSAAHSLEEKPTGAFVGAGSLWPLTATIGNIALELWLPPEFLSFVKSCNYNN